MINPRDAIQQGSKKAAKGTLTAAKWVSPVGFISTELRQFKRNYENINELIDIFNKAQKGSTDQIQDEGIANEVTRLHSTATAGVATAMLVFIVAITSLVVGLNNEDQPLYFVFAALFASIAAFLTKTHLSAKKQLAIPFQLIKLIRDNERAPVNSPIDKQLFYYRAKVSAYTYALIGVFILVQFFDVDTLSEIASFDLGQQFVSGMTALIGAGIIFARAGIAYRDMTMLRAQIGELNLVGFYNLSHNINAAYFHMIYAIAIFFSAQFALDYIAVEVPAGVLTALAKLLVWLVVIWTAWGLVCTYRNYVDMVSVAKPRFRLANAVIGYGVGLPFPRENGEVNEQVDTSSSARMLAIMPLMVIPFFDAGWSLVLGLGAIVLISAVLFAIADIRQELARG